MCRTRCAAAAARRAWSSSPATATRAASSCAPPRAWSSRPRWAAPSMPGAARRPTVVIVSACHSGIFLTPAMRQPNRVVLTAAAAARVSFGCGAGDQYTYYDQCLLQQFDGAATWRELAGATRACVESLERRMGVKPPSQPQIFVGAAVDRSRRICRAARPLVRRCSPDHRREVAGHVIGVVGAAAPACGAPAASPGRETSWTIRRSAPPGPWRGPSSRNSP